MAEDVASVVICEVCGERVAEILVEGETPLCSKCHLEDLGGDARAGGEADE